MPLPRKQQICLAQTPYYHCYTRCVRRAHLCGYDKLTGQSYEHRRAWVEQLLFTLTNAFAIDVCAYAVMSNHVHLVLHVNEQEAHQWSTKDVLQRWLSIRQGSVFAQRVMDGETLHGVELSELDSLVSTYRHRLTNISEFMAILSETIARRANKEDEVTGRFWEGRFKSKALLDEAALLSCMAYVDLNPIRADIASSFENSDFTSIKKRLECLHIQASQPDDLMPFHSNNETHKTCLPFSLQEYLQLIEQTRHHIKEPKNHSHLATSTSLLSHLNLQQHNWLTLTQVFDELFQGPVGNVHVLTEFYAHQNKKRRTNLSVCKMLFH